MKKAFFASKSQMELKDVDKPTIQQPDDVIIKVLRACVWLRPLELPGD